MSELLCKATTKNQAPCKNKAGDSGYCHLHNQANQPASESIINTNPWWQKKGFWIVMGPAMFSAMITIGLHLAKSDSEQAEQICNGDDCVIIRESSGTININTKKKPSYGGS